MTRQLAPEWVSSSVDDDPGVSHCFLWTRPEVTLCGLQRDPFKPGSLTPPPHKVVCPLCMYIIDEEDAA